MPYTVTQTGGATDADFLDYTRLLRQTGLDLARLPRVAEPGTRRRWLCAWNRQDEAQAFADELNQDRPPPVWEALEVSGPVSEGPLGPFVIQLVRQSDGLTFALHPLSRALIRSAFPRAAIALTYATIDTATWQDFRKTRGNLGTLVADIVPNLTGLTREQAERLGYAVVDADNDKTLVLVPPADLVHGTGGDSGNGPAGGNGSSREVSSTSTPV
jgi:hypothetical protein